MRATAGAAIAALLVTAPAAAAAPAIHAHRGGTVLAGVPTYPEETMPAYRNAAREGWWLELDVKLTADGVPVAIHDDTLDRTTNCSGPVYETTLAQLRDCRADVLGSGLPTSPAQPNEPIPTVAEVLDFARHEGAFVSLEIKNLPTDGDFDLSGGYANRVMDVILASGLPRERLLVQSFWPDNLDVAERRLPGVETSFLTLSETNDQGPAFAAANGYEWVSPAWPVSAGYVEDAHGLGRRVVPYTLNEDGEVREAAAIGVDALFTDDPLMAQRTLGLSRAQLLPEELRPSVELGVPPYASDVARGPRFPLRWSGEDRGSGIESYLLEARLNANAADRWRKVAETAGTRARFRGRVGVTYLFRLRARDRFGNLSLYDYAEIAVPRDERHALRFGRGWRRLRSRGAWRGTLTRGRRRGLTAQVRFSASRIALVARRAPRAGRLLVSLDRRRGRVVSLRGPGAQRRVVYRSRVLRPGRHLLRVRTLGGGPVDLDAVGIDQGPPPPRP